MTYLRYKNISLIDIIICQEAIFSYRLVIYSLVWSGICKTEIYITMNYCYLKGVDILEMNKNDLLKTKETNVV